MATTNGSSTTNPEIILYTNHGCPWAHRAHIVIRELGLPYKEEIIDLDRPRDPWYLKVNPVCLLSFSDHIIHTSYLTPSYKHSATYAQSHLTHLLVMLSARSSPQHQIQRRDRHRIGHRLRVFGRRTSITPHPSIQRQGCNQRPLPCPRRLLRRHLFHQGHTQILRHAARRGCRREGGRGGRIRRHSCKGTRTSFHLGRQLQRALFRRERETYSCRGTLGSFTTCFMI